MPDELPPLQPLPESNISPEMIGQLEHSANWASTFGGSDTNLAQRYRHNQDITDYAASLAQQRAAHQAALLQSDKHAQDLYFSMQRMNLQEQEAKARMAHAAELQPLKIQAQQSQIAADLAREKASVQSAALKGRADQQEHDDTAAFHTAVNQGLSNGVKIGTPEYMDLVTRARLAAPAMKSEIFDDIWKATSRSPLTPEDAIQQAVDKKKAVDALEPTDQQKTDAAVARQKALEAARGIPPGVSTQYSAALGEISGLQSQFNAETDRAKKDLIAAKRIKNEEIVRSLETLHPELRATRSLPGTAKAAPATPTFAPGATAVKNGITYVRGDDGKWLPKQ